MTNIKDVAQEAGVSTATVSRVLAGKQNVSSKVRTHVLSVVEKMDYRPNHAARTLRSQKSTTLGLIVSDIRNPFFTSVSRAVEDVAHEAGYSIILCNTDENPEKEFLYLRLMEDENVAGVIFSPTKKTAETFGSLQLNFPTVIVDRDVESNEVDKILLDNELMGYQLAMHLLENGYSKIFGMFGEASTTGRQRRDGLLKALKEADVEPFAEIFTQPRIEAGFEEALRILKSPHPPDAIFTSNSLLTAGALKAIQACGLLIPEEVALVGFDETTWSTLVQPQMTVIAQPTYEIGQTAIKLLLERINNPERAPRKVILNGRLLARGSSIKVSNDL